MLTSGVGSEVSVFEDDEGRDREVLEVNSCCSWDSNDVQGLSGDVLWGPGGIFIISYKKRKRM